MKMISFQEHKKLLSKAVLICQIEMERRLIARNKIKRWIDELWLAVEQRMRRKK